MEIYTLNVGQGQFVVLTGKKEAIIIDTFLPLNSSQKIIYIKAALAKILQGKEFVGVIITGFDADHFNKIGLKIILNKYRPNWIMYPRYFKKTTNADTCFDVINSYDLAQGIKRISVLLSKKNTQLSKELSKEFTFKIFSPHFADMNSSNNCSLVVKIIEIKSQASYLATGDTENDRWESIVKNFGDSIKSDVLDAPHHGSKNGIIEPAMSLIKPDTVLISAGVNNKYGHPDQEAIKIFKKYTKKIYKTNHNKGQSIKTEITLKKVESSLFNI